MRIPKQLLLGFLIAVLFLPVLVISGAAQTPEPQEFPDSGYTVSGPFLTFYRSLPDPYVLLGHPISDADTDTVTGLEVQYFQRARLELHPEAPAGQQVQLSNLGELLYTPGAPLAEVRNSGPACRKFDTGHNVCYAFLQFYDAFQGDLYFGNPISDVEMANGRMVQYFENVRLEWRGEVVNGRHVGLSDMGRFHYDLVRGGVHEYKPPPPGDIIGGPAASLQLRAFVRHSLLNPNSQQTLYIVVQDQKLRPVRNAAISVTVTLPDGSVQSYRPPNTDADGISIFTFNIGSIEVKEIVQVSVSAVLPEAQLEQKTSTWFRIWW